MSRAAGPLGPPSSPTPQRVGHGRGTRRPHAAEASDASSAHGGYSAKHLSVLEGLEAVRKRPGMYIGSTDSRGLMHCLWEILDNSVDEALGSWCDQIKIVLHPDGSAEVSDNGRGIPVDVEPRTKLTGVEVVMTKLHAGGKFGGGSYQASGGLHGVGASVVNALSERLDVEVDRDGFVHRMSFRRGVPGVFADAGPGGGFTKRSGLRQEGETAAGQTGTRVRFWPDRLIFTKDAHFDIAAVHARAQQTTFLVPGLEITVVDDRPASQSKVAAPILDPQTDADLEAQALEEVRAESSQDELRQADESDTAHTGARNEVDTGQDAAVDLPSNTRAFRHEGGIAEFVDHLSSGNPISPVLRLSGAGSFTETVPVLDERGHMTPSEVERELAVDVALRWSDHYASDLRSFVNIVATPKGGTHVTGFERAVVKTFNDYLRTSKILRDKEDNVTKEDVLEGATAVVTVRLAEPQFEGQTKEILGTPAAAKIVGSVISARLGEWLAEPPRGEKNTVRAVLEKVANAMRARVAARAHRDVQRRKTALESSAMPAKLVDCRTGDVQRSELFIVEGNSALGTAKLARDSEFQALLPIRGKILNVHKATIADMLKNAECAAIITVIGAGSGRTFDLESVRYNKIILMADADVDGAHIRTLLLTLFHRYMPELLAAGRVYSAVPPLHRIEILDNRGRVGEVRYTHTDEQMRATLAELARRGKRWKDPVQRYKGLGEMDAVQLRETTMEPGRRTLRRVRVADARVASEVFDLLMGSEVAPRKEFIVAAGADLDRERIDA